MREFGFGAKRVLQPYQNPEAKDFFRAFRPSQEELDNPFLSSPYARQQDALVAQEDMVNQQLAAEQAQMMADQRKASRLEQVYEAEDLANEALASGVPPDEVIQRFPRLAQSPNFSNYMQQAREVRPAQKTLAPHFRSMFKTAEERADFDEAMSQFGDVTRADDYARAKAAERGLRVELIDAGVPLEVLEKAGPLTGEKAAILKRQHKIASTNGDPLAMKGYEEWLRMRVAGDPEGAEVLRKDLEAQGINIFPPKVAPTPAPVASPAPASATAVAPSAASPAAQENIFEDEGDFVPPEKVAEVKRAKIGAPDVDENFYSAFIASPNNSIADKRAALEKFKEFVKAPTNRPGATLGEVFSRKEKLDELLRQAEEDVQFFPEREKYVEAWQQAKESRMGEINDFARSLGVPADTVINSMAKGEAVDTGTKFNPDTESTVWPVRDLFYDFLSKKLGVERSKLPGLPEERLEPFQKSRFAKRLGVESFTLPGLRRVELGSGKKTYQDVLDAVIQDASRSRPSSRPTPSVKIKSIKEIK